MSAGWRADAACRGTDPALFYDGVSAWTARAVCQRCPVAADCLADVLEVERMLPASEVYGVRGGLLASERVELIRSTPGLRQYRRRPVAECGTTGGYYRHRDAGEAACAACKAAHAAAARERTHAATVPSAPAWGQNNLRRTVTLAEVG